jgi:curved DNA-binding protein CbpA
MSEDQNVNKESISDQNSESNVKSSTKFHSQTDFYQILGVNRDADLTQIKEKYLQLVLLYHPDKTDGDDTKFKDVCLAYKVLSNKKKRNEYDTTLASTFDELQDHGQRDTQYHDNNQYKTRADDGSIKFDNESFMKDFSKSLSTAEQEEISRMESKTIAKPKTLADMLRERELETDAFLKETGPPAQSLFDAEAFNKVFDRLKEKKKALVTVTELTNEPIGRDYDHYSSGLHSRQSFLDGESYSEVFGNSDRELITDIMAQGTTGLSVKEHPLVQATPEAQAEAQAKYWAEMETRLTERQNDTNRLQSLKDFIIKPEMLRSDLNQDILADNKLLTIDAIIKQTNDHTD